MERYFGSEKPDLDDLLHYGVKGMKWGVRKDRGGGGQSKHRTRLEAKYINKGLSSDDAKRRADRRIRTEKILAVTAGVTLTAIATKPARDEYVKRFVSVNLKAGTKLKHIHSNSDGLDLNRRLFVTHLEKDTKLYRGRLAKHLQRRPGSKTIFEASLKATENIKAPSHNQAQKLFIEWTKTNPEYATIRKNGYTSFNKYLEFDIKEAKPFYDFMKSKGYNAVLDANDQFLTGYNTKQPLIIFNAGSSLIKTGQSVVEQKVIDGLYNKQMNDRFLTDSAPKIGLGIAAIAGGTKAYDTRTKYAAVNTYLMENPETKRSPSELYARVRTNSNGKYYVS